MEKIFVVYHKDSPRIKSNILTPIHVGRSIANDSVKAQLNDIIGDDTGDNISYKNPTYCELTAQYWAWKNCDADYIGFFHYRRLLNLNEGSELSKLYEINDEILKKLNLTDENIEKLCKNYDIILPRNGLVVPTGFENEISTNYDFYIHCHFKNHIDTTIDILKKKYPEFSEACDEFFNSKRIYYCNMFIMKRELFDDYAQWLFDILGDIEAELESQNDPNQSRLYGYLSERLFNIYLKYLVKKKPDLKIYEASHIAAYSPSFKPVKFDKKRYTENFKKRTSLLPSKEKINIVFSTDDNYVQHTSAAMASILLNSSSQKFMFYILDGGISDENKKNINELKKIKDFEIEYLQIDDDYFSDLPLNRAHISIATYYRLLLPEVLPENVKKVIYLDGDIIVKGDINELWSEDISEYYGAASEDEGSILQAVRLDIPFKNPYFNAGVMVFNIEELRKIDFQNIWKKFYLENKRKIALQDQDILNGVFNGKCKILPLKWNSNAKLYDSEDIYEHHYTYEQADEAAHNPAIIHFTGADKPWKGKCSHLLPDEYYEYLAYTPFKDKIRKYKIKNLLSRIERSIRKVRKKCIKIRFNNSEKSLTLFSKKFKFEESRVK